ncbi:MAG: DEAD/DEAH box helicase [Caldilineaceae bacterium]|nr:DEAD/DEAH box helicase [Caldilineaceae bacterium]
MSKLSPSTTGVTVDTTIVPLFSSVPGSEAVLAAVAEQPASTRAYQLQLMAHRLELVTGFDDLLAVDAIEFAPFAYQIRAARTVLRRFRGRGLLSDEVGLGKTIEAGLVLKEYLVRQMVQRVLILTPPGLVEQWREELNTKFAITDFVTSNDDEFRALGSDAWPHFPFVIASLATARRPEHRKVITAESYDLVIVDEAHHLKNRASVSWKLVNELQKRFILLLTATPVQNSLNELYNLVTVLKPGQLKSPREFQREFVVRGDPRLPKNRGRLRDLLSDVMVRHSRSQIAFQLPPRRAHVVQLELHQDERQLYDAIAALSRRMLTDEAVTSAHRLGTRTLLREAGSSAAATVSTLRSLADVDKLAPYKKELRQLAKQAESVQSSAKAEALHKLLEAQAKSGGTQGKVLVFTQFRATLDLLAQQLQTWGIDFALYHGGLTTHQKNQAIQEFERELPVLLSTEAAGEGRNLQFCRALVNFDLPWNPLRIEQRVGRIHRIGQTEPVDIFNLAAQDTVEQYVLDILDRKLNMFELVIGEMDMILGQLADERDFEEIVMDLWTQAKDNEELAAEMTALGDALVEARASYQQMQEYDDALFGEDFSTE